MQLFFTHLQTLLGLLESKFPLLGVGTVVCYGIGQIGNSHIAQHQFGLLAEMLSPYQPLKSLLYDPVLQEEEQMAITECGCQIVSRNEVGGFFIAHVLPIMYCTQLCKFRVEEKTLFYMPHCGKAMYNNLLWANWSTEHLGKMAIIGNSFNSYYEKYLDPYLPPCHYKIALCRLSSKQLLEEAPYIQKVSF